LKLVEEIILDHSFEKWTVLGNHFRNRSFQGKNDRPQGFIHKKLLQYTVDITYISHIEKSPESIIKYSADLNCAFIEEFFHRLAKKGKRVDEA
jgi:hypothetical protein